MSGITNTINTALSGLQLFEAGINTVSNNLANVTTSGYAAESVNSTTAENATSQPGDGVQPAQIVRAASGFAAAQLRNANSADAAASAQSTALTSISNALMNNGDIQTAINQFFQDISTLASNPTSAAQRQTILSDAQTITSAFHSASGNITDTITGANETLSNGITSANGFLGQLQNINKNLVQSPNNPSLLDQQQSALNSLSQYLPVNVLPQGNGSVIVTSGGTVLLDQSGPQDLAANTSSSGTPSITAGTNATPVTLTAADGSIGGAIGTIQSGNAAQQSLNAMAAIFAGKVNTAQAEGLTPAGAQGSALFSVPSPTVTASSNNSGSATISASISDSSALPTDGGPFLLTYTTANGWTALSQGSGQSYTASGNPPAFAGITLAVVGAPANGNQYTLNPAPNAATGITAISSQTGDIAAADPYVSSPGALQGDGSISNANAGVITAGTDTVTNAPASNAAVIPSSYFGQNLQVNFTSATSYNVTTASNTATVIASGTLGSNGGNIAVAYPSGAAAGQYWQLPISGTPASGDTLTLTPGGSSSGSNAQRMGALWTTASTTTSGSLEQAFVGLSTGLGANAQAAQNLASATSAQVSTATTNLQTVSGVNTDQQAVTLTNYQQAYQAAAQVISAAHTMFESLLQSV